jgi:hypothetical protein
VVDPTYDLVAEGGGLSPGGFRVHLAHVFPVMESRPKGLADLVKIAASNFWSEVPAETPSNHP